jgi:hypothetical protein
MKTIIMTGLSLQFICCATIISLFILIEGNHKSVQYSDWGKEAKSNLNAEGKKTGTRETTSGYVVGN